MPHSLTHTRHHHHRSPAQISMESYRAILQYLGERFVGRAHAGRVGRAARIVRMVSTFGSLGVGIAGIVMVATSVASGGAAVPAWLLIVGGSLIAVNSAAIGIGAVANHMKISQYYDRQAEMHANNEAMRIILEHESQPLPHGFKQYWHHERPLANMIVARRVHDSNGVFGTTVSVFIGMGSVGLLPIAPDAALALFVVSRSSSVLSSTGAQGTNWHRLRAYRRIILRIGEDYRDLTASHKPVISSHAETMVDDVLNHLNLSKFNPYTKLLAFHLYKAIFTVAAYHRTHSTLSPFHPDHWKNCVDAITQLLKSFIKGHHGKYRLSRSALQKIDREHAFTFKAGRGLMDRQSVFDGLFVLEMQMRLKIMETVMPQMQAYETLADEMIESLNINTANSLAEKRLRFQIISALYESAREDMPLTDKQDQLKASIENAITPYLKAETERVPAGRKWFGMRKAYRTINTDAMIFNRDKLVEDYPVGQHAHGDNFHTNFHMEMLREKMRGELTMTYQQEATATKKAAKKIKERVKQRVKKSQRLFEGSLNTAGTKKKMTKLKPLPKSTAQLQRVSLTL